MKNIPYLTLLFCSLFVFQSKANAGTFSIETAISTFSSGAGLVVSFEAGHWGFVLGGGSVLNEDFGSAFSPAAGIKFYFSKQRSSFYLGSAYGRTYYKGALYNPDIGYSGASRDEINLYFGPSFVAGYRFLFGSETAFTLTLGGGIAYKPQIDYGWKTESAGWIPAPDLSLGIAF